ncbi:alpha/beta hydrolase [Actinoplanes solisilvae]|uniref:alpha/beta hydrolase n=1 Tax=Actinoplanes solisilvae TaxID=2486853 RepID=UPI000FDCBB42|nr:alpha/beta hydrolase [Actinoplanes solisilvae]
MRRILAAVVTMAAGLLLGGAAMPLTAQAHDDQGGFDPPSLAWGTCDDPRLQQLGAECGFVPVPLDYVRPGGAKIEIAVSRIKHTSPEKDYQGVMLTNPGGPGGSGLVYPLLSQFVPDGVGADYDWIGFDPRGVGSSKPALSCDVNYAGYNRPYYVPETPTLEKTWLDRTKAYARDCDRAGGALLDHLKTTDNVADMESIRRALGAKQINFYGFSYGTYLAQVYATQHPDRVRRMVLDGNVDPRRVWYGANLDQEAAFDQNINTYFGWLAQHDATYHLGKTANVVRAKYYTTQQKLRTAPAAGKIGPDEWTDIFTSAGYYVFGWADVATAFSTWVNSGDASGLLGLYAAPGGASADNSYAIYLATSCTDTQWPQNWSTWKRDAWSIHAKHPFGAWSNTWFNAPCRNWAAEPGTAVRVDGAKTPSVLLINETNDAATPYAGALEVRKRFPRSVLVEGVGGTTHAGSLNGVACVDNTIASYLHDGTLPARGKADHSDKQCDPVPVPDPTAAKAKTAASITRADLQHLIGR